MDKIRIDVFGKYETFVHLFGWGAAGIVGGGVESPPVEVKVHFDGTVNFMTGGCMSQRNYRFEVVDGDLEFAEFSEEHGFHHVSFRPTAEARARRSGVGRLRIVDGDNEADSKLVVVTVTEETQEGRSTPEGNLMAHMVFSALAMRGGLGAQA